ncbi:Concanavalin A-like lectin/glucanases superfamily protein [Roseivivax marinus]|nr:Concanavalin A-like lectin/glucanases superfamily protein [Roseivivax marinus]
MPTGGETIAISTRAELLDALSSASGGETLVLANGRYGDLDVDNRSFGSEVTIVAQNRLGAKFDSVSVSNSDNVRIDGVHVDNPSNGTGGSYVVGITDGSTNVSFVNSEVNGPVDGNYSGHYGIYSSTGSRNVTFENNYVHDVKNGGTFINTSDLTVSGNTIDYIGNDSFKFLSIDGALIEDNIGASHVYASDGAHLDFIQFQGSDSRDITIRGNVYLPETAADVQGIFMDDAHYTNVLIEENIIVTGMIRGISVTSGTNVVARNNTVLDIPGTGSKATFVMVPDGQSYNNIQSAYPGHALGEVGGNLVVQNADPNGAWHYDDLFANADEGLGVTLEGLAPVAGSEAENYGAYDRLMELLNGTSYEPEPAPTQPEEPTEPEEPDTTEEPDSTEEPVVEEEPAAPTEDTSGDVAAPETGTLDGAAFSLVGDLSIGSRSDVMEVAHDAAFELDAGTLAMSFTLDEASSRQGLVTKDASYFGGGGNHFAAYVENNILRMRFQDGETSEEIKVDGIKGGQAYDLQVGFDGTEAVAWLDGTKVGSVDTGMSWADNVEYMQLGGLGWGSASGASGFTAAMSGTISDVVLVDGVRTPSAIESILADGVVPAYEPDAETDPEPTPTDGPSATVADAALSLLDPMDFERQSDVLEFAPSDALNIADGTIALTFETDDTSGREGILTRDASYFAGDGNHLSVYLENDTLKVRFQDGASEKTVSVDGIEANRPYGLQLTFDGAEAKVWLDGELVDTVDTGMSWESSPEYLQVGGLGWGSASGEPGSRNSFDGTIEDLVILEDVWSPDEVQQIIAEADTIG